MADKFDPYRERLVMETRTVWPEEFDGWEAADRRRVEEALHADPENVANLEYVRTPSGFCRQITVTPEDVERLSGVS